MSKLNKLVTNYPVTLTPEEVENLSLTLSAVETAGGGGGKTYHGDNIYIGVDNINNTIRFLDEAAEKLNRTIPSAVSDLSDSANYQTVEEMSDYLTTARYNSDSATFLTNEDIADLVSKTELENASAEITGLIPDTSDMATQTWVGNQGFLTEIPTGYLTKVSADTLYQEKGDYLVADDITGKADKSEIPTKVSNLTDSADYQTVVAMSNYYDKTQTSAASEIANAFAELNLYDVTAAAGIEITTATDNHVTTFGISLTAEPVVTDTKLSGYNGIAAALDGNISGQWNVGLTQDILTTINGKLASSDFITYTGTTAPNTYLTKTSADILYQPTGDYVTTADVLTGTSNTLTGIKIGSTDYTIPTTDLSNYYTKMQVDSTFASASQLNSYLTTAQYQTDSASFALKTDTSSKNELSTEFAKYTKTEDLNIPTKVSDLTDSATYAKKTDLEEFVTSSDITTQDTDYVMTTTGWKILTLPGGGMTQVIHDTTLTGQGNANDSKLGVAWSALSGNTIASALSAGSATIAANLGTSSFADITGAINAKADATAISDMLTKTEAAQTYQTIVGMSDYLTTTVASQTYLDKTTYATDSAKYVTSGNEISAANEQYALTTTGWTKIATPTTFTGVTTTGSISGGGVNNDTIGLLTSAENALTDVANKVAKPDTTQTELNNNYLIYSTLTGAGTTTGWMPLSANYYSKSEANGTFVATANIDTTTLSGDGKSVSTKLGVKTDVIATTDYVNSSFLPLTGGTVSGQLVVSGGSTFDQENLKLIRSGQNGYGRIGLASNGALAVKVDDSNSNTTQINVAANASYNELIQVQHGGTTAYLIPAVTSTTTAGLTNDGILHIILES